MAGTQWTNAGGAKIWNYNMESVPLWMAFGDGGTIDPTESDSALQNEVARVALSTQRRIGWSMRFEGFINSQMAAGKDINESAIYDAASGGNMLLRSTFTKQTKAAGQNLTHTINAPLANET